MISPYIGFIWHLFFFTCGPLQPSERGLLPRFLRRGTSSPRQSAPAAPHALARGIDAGIYDWNLCNLRAFPALSAF